VGETLGAHGVVGVVYRVWFGRPKGKNHWKDLGVEGRITLRCTLRN